MACKKALILLLLLASCGPTMRRINVCVINGNEAQCARGDEQFTKTIEEMGKWKAIDELSIDYIATKLTDCEVKGSLPPEQSLKVIEICTIQEDISHVDCSWNGVSIEKPIGYIQEFYATDEAGLQKIRSKLNFCGEKNEITVAK